MKTCYKVLDVLLVLAAIAGFAAAIVQVVTNGISFDENDIRFWRFAVYILGGLIMLIGFKANRHRPDR